MDRAVERLNLDQVRAPSPIASEHLHRYELAAGLCQGLRVADVCCGVGYGARILRERGARSVVAVDADREAIEAARGELAGLDGVELVEADASSYLEAAVVGELDAIVCFEGIEHLPDPERALAALRRLAADGVRLCVSIPNSRGLGEEENPFHHTDYDHESASAALRGLGDDVAVLYQFAAEGSLIGAGEGGDEIDGRTTLDERGDPDLASHFIALVGFGDAAALASTRMVLEVAPLDRRYMGELERANGRLWDRIQALEARLERIESSPLWRAAAPIRAARSRFRSRGS